MAKKIKQAPLTTAKMFNANWTEKDEAILVELLKRKIHELKFDIRDATSPYAKNRLKDKRVEYKVLLSKVEAGEYDPNILANELKTYSQYKDVKLDKKTKKLGRYADAYTDVDFDYEAYFSKTRYFGASLPIILLILTIAFVGLILAPMFIPVATMRNIDAKLSGAFKTNVSLSSISYFKLGEGENDFSMVNNGQWPKGQFQYEEQTYEQGEKYAPADSGVEPPRVLLYTEAGMSAIDITTVDILKAMFKTDAFAANRLDPIENLSSMQGPSWYHLKYIRDRKEDLKFRRNEDGKYDKVSIVRAIATYGTIAAVGIMIIACVIEIILNIGRLFSYTSRRLHFFPLLIIICGIATMLFPALLEVTSVQSADISEAFKSYFNPNWTNFMETPSSKITFNLLFPIFLIFPVISSILPLFFRNREAKTVAYVPKGNRPHTYQGHSRPTKPGKPGQAKLPPNRGPQGAPQRVARAGTKPAYNPRTPGR